MWCDHGKLGHVHEEMQIENYAYAFLAESMYTKTRPRAPEKARGAANLQSSQKISISRACETKLGRVLSFLENIINKLNTCYGKVLPLTLDSLQTIESQWQNFSITLMISPDYTFSIFKQAKYMVAWRCRISLLMFVALTREIFLSCDLCDQ